MTNATNLDVQVLPDEALDEVVGGLAQQSVSRGTLQNMLHQSPILALINRILDPRIVTMPVHLPLPPR